MSKKETKNEEQNPVDEHQGKVPGTENQIEKLEAVLSEKDSEIEKLKSDLEATDQISNQRKIEIKKLKEKLKDSEENTSGVSSNKLGEEQARRRKIEQELRLYKEQVKKSIEDLLKKL